ncbi:YiiX/YebB-like N1pC/P60 family cysteine hydrolase [Sunxiuqinia rutila]|uniref:YiiX/YebB-like N1pC/P60 family cysteine hydrolase n=1 Tax=Sunxiuqinia rutila TaxID=1397841 RepID=UPI003D362366
MKFTRKKYRLLMAFFMLGLSLNAQQIDAGKLQNGDLLFSEPVSGRLSEAIDQVTQTHKQTHFSHVGMAILENDAVYVLHASAEGGTCQVTLDQFLHPNGDSTQVTVYRLKPAFQKAIAPAIAKAKNLLGKPYNFSYVLSDTSHYCSEFIYRGFEEDSIFVLNPMTFKNPATSTFSPAWVAHYEKLSMDIPEGLPGCNPNGMAASEKLERLGLLIRPTL